MTPDWDHNAYYHQLVLDQLAPTCGRVLDLGCGAGALAVKLAARADQVDALDRAPEMIDLARRRGPKNVTFILADIDDYPLPLNSYDAIVSVAVLHHLRAEDILPRLAAALRPGGVLVILGLPARDLVADWYLELTSTALNPVWGAAFAVRRRIGHRTWYAHEESHAVMPVSDHAPLTARQVGELARRELPGSRVRRLLFWRYLLVWHKL